MTSFATFTAPNLGHTLPVADVVAMGATPPQRELFLETCCPQAMRAGPFSVQASASGYLVRWPGPFAGLTYARAHNCRVQDGVIAECVHGPVLAADSLPEPSVCLSIVTLVAAAVLFALLTGKWR